jgi:hypothetical protein
MTYRLARRPAALLVAGIVALALVLRILWLRTDSTPIRESGPRSLTMPNRPTVIEACHNG